MSFYQFNLIFDELMSTNILALGKDSKSKKKGKLGYA